MFAFVSALAYFAFPTLFAAHCRQDGSISPDYKGGADGFINNVRIIISDAFANTDSSVLNALLNGITGYNCDKPEEKAQLEAALKQDSVDTALFPFIVGLYVHASKKKSADMINQLKDLENERAMLEGANAKLNIPLRYIHGIPFKYFNKPLLSDRVNACYKWSKDRHSYTSYEYGVADNVHPASKGYLVLVDSGCSGHTDLHLYVMMSNILATKSAAVLASSHSSFAVPGMMFPIPSIFHADTRSVFIPFLHSRKDPLHLSWYSGDHFSYKNRKPSSFFAAELKGKMKNEDLAATADLDAMVVGFSLEYSGVLKMTELIRSNEHYYVPTLKVHLVVNADTPCAFPLVCSAHSLQAFPIPRFTRPARNEFALTDAMTKLVVLYYQEAAAALTDGVIDAMETPVMDMVAWSTNPLTPSDIAAVVDPVDMAPALSFPIASFDTKGEDLIMRFDRSIWRIGRQVSKTLLPSREPVAEGSPQPEADDEDHKAELAAAASKAGKGEKKQEGKGTGRSKQKGKSRVVATKSLPSDSKAEIAEAPPTPSILKSVKKNPRARTQTQFFTPPTDSTRQKPARTSNQPGEAEEEVQEEGEEEEGDEKANEGEQPKKQKASKKGLKVTQLYTSCFIRLNMQIPFPTFVWLVCSLFCFLMLFRVFVCL